MTGRRASSAASLSACFLSTLLAVGCVVLLPGSAWGDTQARHFAIKMNDRLIGYASVAETAVDEGDRKLIQITSRTLLKIALLGKERRTSLESTTWYDATTRRPVRFQLRSTTNGTVRKVESSFTDKDAKTIITLPEEDPGDPVVTELGPSFALLSNNNFAHWEVLLREVRKQVKTGGDQPPTVIVPAFVPDVPSGQILTLQRLASGPAVVAGVRRTVETWSLKSANLNALVDRETGELLRIELPAQQTVVERAAESVVKLAEKSAAEEVLDRHFAPSNVKFDDFLQVTQLEVTLDVQLIGSGANNSAAVLSTRGQSFQGTKRDAHVAGKLTVRTKPFAPEKSPKFPLPKSLREQIESQPTLASALKPEPLIESEDAAIQAKSRALTREAKSCWEAIERIGSWVHQEIAYEIADTPSARRALKTRKGDCGPHATLMVALLRAAGIPAKLVGGLVYTPTFGGSFGQHAWVEVWLGDAGWISVDPTTGEFAALSATHIKLFEGMGGVIPKKVEVTSYAPRNRARRPGLEVLRPFPWKLKTKYVLNYRQGDQHLGSESFILTQVTRDGNPAYLLESDLALQLNPLTAVRSTAKLTVAPNGRPLALEREVSGLSKTSRIACTFGRERVEVAVTGPQELTREISLPAGAFCFDNNFLGAFALICAQLPLTPETPVVVDTFHASSLQLIPLTFTCEAAAPIELHGKQVPCFKCEVAPINNTFWITKEGQFVRAKQGQLVIELAEPHEDRAGE